MKEKQTEQSKASQKTKHDCAITYITLHTNLQRALHVNSQANLERCDGARTITHSRI